MADHLPSPTPVEAGSSAVQGRCEGGQDPLGVHSVVAGITAASASHHQISGLLTISRFLCDGSYTSYRYDLYLIWMHSEGVDLRFLFCMPPDTNLGYWLYSFAKHGLIRHGELSSRQVCEAESIQNCITNTRPFGINYPEISRAVLVWKPMFCHIASVHQRD